MRIVITGREGQLARSLLKRAAASGHEIVAIGRPELDLTNDAEAIARVLAEAKPDAIVSAAAYTAVDKAEDDRELAFDINGRGAGYVAVAAHRLKVPLVHLSTDYVFNGLKPSPYTEDDATDPAGVYGASKLAGEQAVLAAHDNVAILRTAWVYSPFGTNFVKTILRLSEERAELSIVADQQGNPTSAFDIADAVIEVIANLCRSTDPQLRGIFHMTGQGDTSWAGFATAILAASEALGGPTARVRPISTSEYPTKAKRPANSRLDNSKLAETFGLRLPAWQHSLEPVVSQLLHAQV